MSKNFLAETLDVMSKNDRLPIDVCWVGSHNGEYAIAWREFAMMADKIWYDAGFGAQEIASDLVVVGSD